MKKIAFVLVALMTLALTGCKTETSKVSIYVEDSLGLPVANRYVFYADYASIVISEVLPSPEALALETEDCWEVASTNAVGVVNLNIPLAVAKLKYRFIVYDAGSNDWVINDVELQRGKNEDITFKVNK